MRDDEENNTIYLNADEWDWLMKFLDEEPEVNENLAKLFRETKGMEHDA